MDSISREHAGRAIPHCEVVSRTLDPFRDINPSGVARLRWTDPNGKERRHDLGHWLRLDELFTFGQGFRVELQARREATFELPLFSAQRDFVFTGDTGTVTDVAVGMDGDLGWVYGVVVVGANPATDKETAQALPFTQVDPPTDGWGAAPGTVPGALPADVLRELVARSAQGPSPAR